MDDRQCSGHDDIDGGSDCRGVGQEIVPLQNELSNAAEFHGRPWLLKFVQSKMELAMYRSDSRISNTFTCMCSRYRRPYFECAVG